MSPMIWNRFNVKTNFEPFENTGFIDITGDINGWGLTGWILFPGGLCYRSVETMWFSVFQEATFFGFCLLLSTFKVFSLSKIKPLLVIDHDWLRMPLLHRNLFLKTQLCNMEFVRIIFQMRTSSIQIFIVQSCLHNIFYNIRIKNKIEKARFTSNVFVIDS